MKYKTGDYVVCIDPGSNPLIKGQKYKVMSTDGKQTIVDGNPTAFNYERFELVPGIPPEYRLTISFEGNDIFLDIRKKWTASVAMAIMEGIVQEIASDPVV